MTISVKRIMRIPLTGMGLFGYQSVCKAMLLVVAITEATTRCELAEPSQECLGPARTKPFIGSE
jgi:hypothetical protein